MNRNFYPWLTRIIVAFIILLIARAVTLGNLDQNEITLKLFFYKKWFIAGLAACLAGLVMCIRYYISIRHLKGYYDGPYFD